MTSFTPVESLVGGMMIGSSALLLMHGLGRIAGISGILGGLFSLASRGDVLWRLGFLAGLIAAGFISVEVTTLTRLFDANLPLRVEINASLEMLLLSGLLVGFGTRLGSGCTSGHGVCGLGRLSFRSLVATFIFMTVAAATVWLFKLTGGA